jgi:hypothetical protein
MRDRFCCDGACADGHGCPVVRRRQDLPASTQPLFAPGVVTGHRLTWRARIARRLRALLLAR